MSEKLKYGFQTFGKRDAQSLRVDVPPDVWHAAEESPGFSELVDLLRDAERAVIALNGRKEVNPHFIVNETRLRRADIGKEGASEATLRVIHELEAAAGNEAADPCLKAILDLGTANDSKFLKPVMSVGLPEQLPDRDIALAATRAMVGMARGLRYQGMNERAKGVIHARVDREEGDVSLTVDSRSGRFVQTGLSNNYTGSDQALLTEARIVSHEEQLIGFTGAVALARSDELVAKE